MHLDDAQTQISSTASAAMVENPFFAIGSTGHCRSIPPCPDNLGWVRSTESIEKMFVHPCHCNICGWIGKVDKMKRRKRFLQLKKVFFLLVIVVKEINLPGEKTFELKKLWLLS